MSEKTIITIEKEEVILKRETRNIDQLFFNPFNTRYESYLKNDNFSIEDLLEKENQDKIFKLFLNDKSKAMENLRSSIRKDGKISEPLTITKDNIVLSGNNRLSILKKMKYKDNIPVFVFPREGLTAKEIDHLEIQLQYKGQEKVDYKTYQKAMKIHKYKYTNNYNIEEIADFFYINENEVRDNINLINEFYTYINIMGNPKYETLFEEIDVFSVVRTISKKNLFNKVNKNCEKKIRDILYLLPLTRLPENIFNPMISKISNSQLKNEEKLEIFSYVENCIIKKTGDSIKKAKELIASGSSLKSNDDLQSYWKSYNPKSLSVEIVSYAETELKKFIDPITEIEKILKKINNDIKKINLSKINDKTNIKTKLNDISRTIEIKLKDIT